ncbi:MAG TPA: ATP-binding cassette domain-containing protein, partial [Streptosporangiaceae bacterium]|nr:ATP-binding cassette domain-containing protein [Streptosporangiaceae bacterium]
MGADGHAAAGAGQPDPAGSAPGPPGSGPSASGPSASGPSASGSGQFAPDPSGSGPSATSGAVPPDPPAPPDPANPPAQPAGQASAGPRLSLVHAAKSFGAVRAVVDGSIDLYGGEAHALVGENGAGKSTVVKMLAGVHQLDAGQLLIEGQPVVLSGPAAAQAAGIAVIYQEPTLFPDLTVAENIFMGQQPLLAARRIDRRLMRTQSAALFERLGVQLDPGRISRGLSIADQQIVEIAKALTREAQVIVMDE